MLNTHAYAQLTIVVLFLPVLLLYLMPISHGAVVNEASLTEEKNLSLTEIEVSREPDAFSIAKCRQRCFLKTLDRFKFRHGLDSEESFEICRKKSSCHMCHDYCRGLALAAKDLAASMCGDKHFCMKGCRIACNFYQIKSFNHLLYEVLNKA